MVRTACLVCLISTDTGRNKQRGKTEENVVLVAGTQQTFSNKYFLSVSTLPAQVLKIWLKI